MEKNDKLNNKLFLRKNIRGAYGVWKISFFVTVNRMKYIALGKAWKAKLV
jgi:hypothetical protein